MGTTSSDDSLLPVVALSTDDSTAEVHLFGGCVTSYSKGGVEQLAHRLDSRLDGVKPISGGIPFCFPQFGPGALQQRARARVRGPGPQQQRARARVEAKPHASAMGALPQLYKQAWKETPARGSGRRLGRRRVKTWQDKHSES